MVLLKYGNLDVLATIRESSGPKSANREFRARWESLAAGAVQLSSGGRGGGGGGGEWLIHLVSICV